MVFTIWAHTMIQCLHCASSLYRVYSSPYHHRRKKDDFKPNVVRALVVGHSNIHQKVIWTVARIWTCSSLFEVVWVVQPGSSLCFIIARVCRVMQVCGLDKANANRVVVYIHTIICMSVVRMSTYKTSTDTWVPGDVCSAYNQCSSCIFE